MADGPGHSAGHGALRLPAPPASAWPRVLEMFAPVSARSNPRTTPVVLMRYSEPVGAYEAMKSFADADAGFGESMGRCLTVDLPPEEGLMRSQSAVQGAAGLDVDLSAVAHHPHIASGLQEFCRPRQRL